MPYYKAIVLSSSSEDCLHLQVVNNAGAWFNYVASLTVSMLPLTAVSAAPHINHLQSVLIDISVCPIGLNGILHLQVIKRLAGESGLLVSLVLIVRVLPSLLLFPITGVVVDRCPFRALMHGCCTAEHFKCLFVVDCMQQRLRVTRLPSGNCAGMTGNLY